MITIKVEVKTPSLPNFIRSSLDNVAIPIEMFSDNELEVIGKQWTADLIKLARKRREQLKTK